MINKGAEATIAAIMDLVKACERASLHVPWEAGKQLKFDAGVLVAACS